MKYSNFKRMMDIILSSTLIVTLFPVFMCVGALVKIDSKGPIIFKQSRIGKDGNKFMIYKFRTMSSDNNVLKKDEPDHVTHIGRFLRKYGIDELPQLFNIFKGEMSFIGPRPHVFEYFQYYTKEQQKRLEVLPGMLGPNACSIEKRTILNKNDLDIKYVNNLSLKQDIDILCYTLSKAKLIFNSREASSFGNKKVFFSEITMLKEQFEEEQQKNKKIETNSIDSLDETKKIKTPVLYKSKNKRIK